MTTLVRDGWLECPDGQKGYAVRPDGEAFVCLQPDCGAEFPDRDTFEGHVCANYRDVPELKKHEAPEAWADMAITDAAAELAIEEGVDPTEVTGSGRDGRILVSDIRDKVEE